MHRLIPAALALLAFTNPNGVTIYIEADAIVAVTPGVGYCKEPALTRLDLGDAGYCVRETVEEAVARIRGAAPADEEDK